MSLRQGMPVGAGCRFRESFENVLGVTDQGGVIVASSVDRGISPLGVSARVTYDQTQALLINASQMTVCVAFRTGTITAITPRIVCKAPSALNDNQFFLQLDGGSVLSYYISNAAGDFGQVIRANTPLTSNTEYFWHCVYNGTLAAGSRGVLYNNGLAVSSTIAGTLPTSMRASVVPVTLFNLFGATGNAPPTDFILRLVRIFDTGFSADECLDDYQQDTFQEITP